MNYQRVIISCMLWVFLSCAGTAGSQPRVLVMQQNNSILLELRMSKDSLLTKLGSYKEESLTLKDSYFDSNGDHIEIFNYRMYIYTGRETSDVTDIHKFRERQILVFINNKLMGIGEGAVDRLD